MAVVDPASSSGYASPMVRLIQRGLVKDRDPKTFFREVLFAGAHDAGMRALLNGHVDALASFDMAREQYLTDPAERERIIYIAETPEIPEAGIAARSGLDPATFAKVREVRRQIGMVFQQFNLVRRASAIDNVLAGRLGYVPPVPSVFGSFPPADRELARACLDQVGLGHLAQRRADTLSGGEQQRVAIARALAQRPAVILADEPTASLDPALTGSIMDILKAINVDQGLTLVVSQHQLETALAYGTRIVGFRQGRVAFDGPPASVTPTVVRAIYGESPDA